MALTDIQKQYVNQGGTIQSSDPQTQQDYADYVKQNAANPISINSQTTAPTTPINPPNPPAPAPINTNTQSIIDFLAGLFNTGNTDTSAIGDRLKSLLGAIPQPPSTSDLYTASQTGIDQKQSDYNARQAEVQAAQDKFSVLNAQLQGLNYQAKTVIPNQQIQEATGRRSVSQANALTSAQQRDVLLQAAPIQFQALIAQSELANAQGRAGLAQSILQQAQTHADTIFKVQEQDSINQYNYRKDLIDKVFQFADKEQQKQLTEQKDTLTKNQASLTDALNVAQGLIPELTKNQPDLAAKILQLNANRPDINSKTFSADLQKYNNDLAQITAQIKPTPLQQQQLINEKLQTQKLQNDIAVANQQEAAVNPNVLQGMLNVYKSTGVLPAFGYSAKSPLRAQFYAALGSPDGAQIVTDANTNKSIRAGLTTAYRTQQNLLSANQTAIGTLKQQLTLAQQYSDKVSRSDSPFINKYLLGIKQGVFGDPETAAFNNIVKTASYEFAKVLSGAAASIAGVTVSSSADTEAMINSALAKGQFNTVIGLMQKEAQFRLSSQKDTLNQIQKDLNNVGSLSTDLKNAPVIKSYGGQNYNVPAGEVLIQRNGQIGSVPEKEFNPKTDTKL